MEDKSKAWVTRQFFIEWIHQVFAPSVKKYLQEKQFLLRAFPIMEKAPAHPPGLEKELVEYSFITVRSCHLTQLLSSSPWASRSFMILRNSTQRRCLRGVFEVTFETNLTLKEFWKEHFNNLTCLRITKHGVMCLLGPFNQPRAWKKLWPGSVL